MQSPFEAAVIAAVQARAEAFGLVAGALEIHQILNWGGFVAESFRVTDGARSIHLKLAADQADMRRWWLVRDHLERHYRAPRVLGWVDVPGTALGGLAFDHIPGATWDPAARPDLLGDLRDLLGRLHADGPLTDRLGGGSKTYRACWDERYRSQFEEDLATIRPNRPSVVTDDRLARMEAEARRVLALPAADPAFDGITQAPCHWDLWENNVIVEPGGAWWVLDWDGLAIGDPAEDFATLAWPVWAASGRDWRERFPDQADGPLAARIDRHIQAITLDYAIDVLADWADCPDSDWRAEVRPIKEAQHQRFWDLYRAHWASLADG